MKSFKWIGFVALLSCSFVLGCGGGGTAPVADEGEVADFVADNPDIVDDTLEPEEEVVGTQ